MENLNQETQQNQANDLWQAEVLGQIYDTNFNEIAEWIVEGAIQSSDKVRRGNLRWINAGKVPTFVPFFNARGNGVGLNDVKVNHTQFSDTERMINSASSNNCFIHEQQKAAFECEICRNEYCQNCFPDEQNKDCPICGAHCRPMNLLNTAVKISNSPAETENFVSPISGTKSTQKFDSSVSLPSDVLKTKSKRISILFVIIFALFVSGLGSYFWAYEYNLESEAVLESLPEVAALDTKFKLDSEQAVKNKEQHDAEKKRKEELKKVNENQYTVDSGPGDFKNDVNEIDDQMAINKFKDAETLIKETHSRERASTIRNHEESHSKQHFIEAFICLFIFSFCGLFAIRYFTKK